MDGNSDSTWMVDSWRFLRCVCFGGVDNSVSLHDIAWLVLFTVYCCVHIAFFVCLLVCFDHVVCVSMVNFHWFDLGCKRFRPTTLC